MPKTDITIVIGGDAGQGIETIGQSFTKALSTCGLRIFGLQDSLSDELREFLRKQGIRFAPIYWRYKKQRER